MVSVCAAKRVVTRLVFASYAQSTRVLRRKA
jgi:hypothetical protein